MKSTFKSAAGLVFLLCTGVQLQAATYYFSTVQGDDNRSATQAQNAATPWRSVDKLNSVWSQINPGDSILFKCGEIFYGSIVPTKSGSNGSAIAFSSYGSGAKPQITGFVTPTAWTNAGNNTWETTLSTPQQRVASVLYKGSSRAAGRYPNADAANKGYLNFESAQGTSSITDLQLNRSQNWTGGEVVIRKARWVIDRNVITQHRGGTLEYTSQSGYGTSAGYGYFIQNHPQTLDQDGEWYYRASDRKFGIYSTSGAPATGSVSISTLQNIVSIVGQSYLSFSNLSFTGANENAFHFDRGANNVSIKNCEMLYSYNGVTAWGANNVSIEGCVISNNNNNACRMEGSDNIILKNNTVNSTGTFAGMGDGDSGSYQGLMVSGSNQLIEGNNIDSCGYVAISFRGSNVVVKNNVITNFSFVKDDGSGIYTWNNGSNPPTYTGEVISNNIVLNGVGAGEGTPDPEHKYANGIYMDDNTSGVEISGNTVANCSNYGFYIHNAHELVIQNNTVYDNAVQLEMTHDDIAPYPIRNVSMTGNKFVSKTATQAVAEFKTNGNDISSFGNFDNNYYGRPFFDDLQIGVLTKINGTYKWDNYNLNSWKAAYGKDQQSQSSPLTFIPYKVNNFLGNNLFPNAEFNSNTASVSAYSDANNSSLNWVNNVLDGGAIQLSFSSNTGTSNGTILFYTGRVIEGHTYVLKFSLKGTVANKIITTYLRKDNGSYNDLVPHEFFSVTDTRSEKQILFTPTANANGTNIVFVVPDAAGSVYIDNVQLTEANISPANFDDSIRLVYNTTATSQSFPLATPYVDMPNNQYTSAVTLGSHQSAVLLKKISSQAPADLGVACTATGSILREFWSNINGNSISAIPLQTTPTTSSQLTSFEGPTDFSDNYGERIRGYICPPFTGNYTFWIAADDAAELWLSSDSTVANKTKIAYSLSWTNPREWNKYSTQKSVSIYLQAGHKYYIESLHKEGGGGDNLAVAWQLPNGNMEAPISGSRLSPFIVTEPTASNQNISFTAIPAKTFGDLPFTIAATASSGLPVSFRLVSGPAVILGNLVTILGVGTVTIQATQIGNAAFNAAAPVTQSFEVSPLALNTCSATGSILREYWSNVNGNDIASIPLQQAPTSSSQLTSFEGPTNFADNYGDRIRGYICPPASGNYTFWIAADDAAELWLSSDSSVANKVKIAFTLSWTNAREWTKYSTQQSASIYLQAGRKYYIESLHKEGGDGDNLAVAWKLPNGTMEAPISGSRLSPFVVTNQVANNQTISFAAIANQTFGTAPITVSATASSGLAVSFDVLSGPATVSGNVVTLTGTGTVTIQATQSGNGSFNAAAPVVQSFNVIATLVSSCVNTGTILREQWNNVTNYSLSAIPVQNTPDITQQLTLFEAPSNTADNYGSRIRGYICPPQTGNYTFWIAADDLAELWLSTTDNEGNKVKIASVPSYTGSREWNKYPSQKSVSIYLQAGQHYYIEALQKEGNGEDNLAVAWQLPSGSVEAPIPGSRLSLPLATLTISCPGTGSIVREQWNNIAGNNINTIPLQTSPSSTSTLSLFESPSNMADNYGARMRGYICPPVSGNYTFWIAADDQAQLWLSNSDNPAGKVQIASVSSFTDIREWNKFSSQKSATIYLQAGQLYYVEALHKQGNGGDNFAVAWQLPNGTVEAPIPGIRLVPFSTNVAARSGGIQTKVSDITNAVKAVKDSVENTAVLYVYPNPLSSTAVVEVNLKQTAGLRLDVMDEQGRIVKVIASQLKENTIHKYQVSRNGLASGVYILRLVTPTRNITKKLVVQ